jgi:hypothetical protein
MMPAKSDPISRFWSYVNKTDACWLWTASLSAGYGQFAPVHNEHVRAHRYAYELLVGSIPDGLDLDHLCHNEDPNCRGGSTCRHRACVNPAHLEPSTRQENLARSPSGEAKRNAAKTRCPQDHPYSGDNLYINATSGARVCRECGRAGERRRYKVRMLAESLR